MPQEETKVDSRVEQEQTFLEWEAPSRPFKIKNTPFLTVPMVIAILAGIIFLFAGEWMLIAVEVAVIFAYYVWSTVPPEEIKYSITSRGVRIKEQLYVWEIMTRWWITDKWQQKMLAIEAPGVLTGRLILPLGKLEEEKIEKVMEKMLLKEKPRDSSLEKMGKWLEEKFPLEQKV